MSFLKRLAAIDPGTKRVGIAVSDELRMLARALPHVSAEGLQATAQRIWQVLSPYDVEMIFVGCPRHMHGGAGEGTQRAAALARELEGLGLSCRLVDERLSTVEARRALQATGRREREIRQMLDSASAVVLLQAMLDAANSEPGC